MFIHVEGTEETSGINATGSYEDSKVNKMEANKVVSSCYSNKLMKLMVHCQYTSVDICDWSTSKKWYTRKRHNGTDSIQSSQRIYKGIVT